MSAHQLLVESDRMCYDLTRFHQPVLKLLIDGLKQNYGLVGEKERIPPEGQVIMFLIYCAHNQTSRELQFSFPQSTATYSKYVKKVSKLCY